MKVFIYRNLHRNCWSIRCQEGENKGKVIHHAESWVLTDAVFRVSHAGRARVLLERRKNVHAGIQGQLQSFQTVDQPNDQLALTDGVVVSYNPYRAAHFFRVQDQQAVHKSQIVQAQGRQVMAYQPS